ncbi:hypothetical protein [Nocardia macrotermitis]|uniref:hypothetical protein n=1 Tax=Nocardia macrotermitis TaxID=2585198 RepID=UPI001298221B|nr:hypothetical protein [Nocardia macrotermitis]
MNDDAQQPGHSPQQDGVVATISSMLAIGSAGAGLGGFGYIIDPQDYYAFAIGDLLVSALFVIGAVMLLRRNDTGRGLLVVLSGIGVFGGSICLVSNLVSGTAFAQGISALAVAVMALMLTLSLSGAAVRWCRTSG